MKVIIMHHENGDTVAVVSDNALLHGIKYTEVDGDDSKKLISGNPDIQSDLQSVFKDVMAIFGIYVAPPQQASEDANAA